MLGRPQLEWNLSRASYKQAPGRNMMMMMMKVSFAWVHSTYTAYQFRNDFIFFREY